MHKLFIVVALAVQTISTALAQAPKKDEFFSTMGDMQIEATKKYLDLLADPEISKKLAQHMRNYYEALVEAGFSEEEALRIMIEIGTPLL